LNGEKRGSKKTGGALQPPRRKAGIEVIGKIGGKRREGCWRRSIWREGRGGGGKGPGGSERYVKRGKGVTGRDPRKGEGHEERGNLAGRLKRPKPRKFQRNGEAIHQKRRKRYAGERGRTSQRASLF